MLSVWPWIQTARGSGPSMATEGRRRHVPPAVVLPDVPHQPLWMHQHPHGRVLVVDEGVEALLHEVAQRDSAGENGLRSTLPSCTILMTSGWSRT